MTASALRPLALAIAALLVGATAHATPSSVEAFDRSSASSDDLVSPGALPVHADAHADADADGLTDSRLAIAIATDASGQAAVTQIGAFFGQISTDVVVADVPEPASYALTLAALGMLGIVARRRRRG